MATKQSVRILVGTRKGAYILDGNSDRKRWMVRGPMHSGGDVYQIIADPRQPGTLFAAANSAFWGPMLHKSKDWGKKWTEVSLPNMARSKARPGPNFDPNTKWPVVNAWQMAFGPESEPDLMYIGIDPASLWRSHDYAETWEPLSGLNDHPTRDKWGPGAGGLCLHTILSDPGNPRRMYIAISAAGGFRTDDGGDHWSPINKGVRVDFLPDKYPEVGQCLHKLSMEPTDPSTIYRQDHNGIYVTHDRGDSWTHVGRALKSDFGFVTATAPAAPKGAYFVPLEPISRATWGNQLQVYRWDDRRKKFRPLVGKGLFPGEHGTHRDALATDNLDPAGIYLGTTAGRLFWSATGGKQWSEVPYSFPGIHSVTVAGPAWRE